MLAILLMLPALLVNLGLMTLLEDESIRALVALEMMYSGDYIVPTLNGSLYFAKPPLYNWILIGCYKLFPGIINEWAVRLPTVLFTIGFGVVIYFSTKKYLGKRFALLNALIFITCGRILFWDSMLGLIDILFSTVTYGQMILIFYGLKQGNYWKAFVGSAFLAAVGFMLKGFPSILFQGITLIVWCYFTGSIKKLFSKESFAGVGLFVVIVGGYYYLYNHSGEIRTVMDGLLDQSTRRTLMHEKNSITDFLKHLISYPFENLYHFLPWTIMVIYLFKKGMIQKIWQHEFMRFNAVIFLANIVVYWTSVEVFPRYILMLIPMVFTIFLFLHPFHKEANTLHFRIVSGFLLFNLLIIILSAGALPFHPLTSFRPHVYLKATLILLTVLGMAYFFYVQRDQRLIIMVCALFIFRLGFDWMVLPERQEGDFATLCKEQALDIGRRYKEKDLRIFKSSKIDYTSSWYLSKTRGRITKHDYEVADPNAFYVIDTIKFDIPASFKKIESFEVREFKRKLWIIQSRNDHH